MPIFDREKFMSHVEKRADNECWPWRGTTDDDGYGKFHKGSHRFSAHRVSYELHTGPLGRQLCVLHSCDTPACVNPAHLRLGTHQENMAERNEKGRQAQGIRNGRAKLSETNARVCRALDMQGWSLQEIADVFTIDRSTVLDVVRGKHWKP